MPSSDERTAKAIDCPGHHHVEFAPACVLQHGIEATPAVSALGAADTGIPVNVDNLPAAALGDLGKLADLFLDRLVVRAHSHVQRGSFHSSARTWSMTAATMMSRKVPKFRRISGKNHVKPKGRLSSVNL